MSVGDKSAKRQTTHQKPIDIHKKEHEEEEVEEKIERDVRDRLKTGYTGGVQHFERKPVKAKPKPARKHTSGGTHKIHTDTSTKAKRHRAKNKTFHVASD